VPAPPVQLVADSHKRLRQYAASTRRDFRAGAPVATGGYHPAYQVRLFSIDGEHTNKQSPNNVGDAVHAPTAGQDDQGAEAGGVAIPNAAPAARPTGNRCGPVADRVHHLPTRTNDGPGRVRSPEAPFSPPWQRPPTACSTRAPPARIVCLFVGSTVAGTNSARWRDYWPFGCATRTRRSRTGTTVPSGFRPAKCAATSGTTQSWPSGCYIGRMQDLTDGAQSVISGGYVCY
jgi:hypothetical protein